MEGGKKSYLTMGLATVTGKILFKALFTDMWTALFIVKESLQCTAMFIV